MRNNQRRTLQRFDAFLEWLKDQPCHDCGGRFPYWCMDFDHVRGEKRFGIARAYSRALADLIDEILKCEVVCANCHRTRTHARKQYGPGQGDGSYRRD